MTSNEYLKKVLKNQRFAEGDKELSDLRERRKEVESLLRSHFEESSPRIRYGGSKAKNTMIREAYDLDITCYFPHDDDESAKPLAEIYGEVQDALAAKFIVEPKTSAIRLRSRSPGEYREDIHVDVVPGRFVDGDEGDVSLHQASGEKQWLKTNLDVHIATIRDSGVVDAIALMKLWNVRNGVNAKTFILELLVVGLLKRRKTAGLSTQLEHVLTQFRDHPGDLFVEDPANPKGNDLTPALDACRWRLQMVASTTLQTIEDFGWEGVFGEVEEEQDDKGRLSLLLGASGAVSQPTKPWCKTS